MPVILYRTTRVRNLKQTLTEELLNNCRMFFYCCGRKDVRTPSVQRILPKSITMAS